MGSRTLSIAYIYESPILSMCITRVRLHFRVHVHCTCISRLLVNCIASFTIATV